ncbi:subclass B1 metallo-beta-lactamase [Ekhidna sp. To15]|uniref:subclass B1 metallo-beta-lactamase n=1 Tax=Ekhidna sp. To15 TaxID=3395267 RepID=UPI003F528020
MVGFFLKTIRISIIIMLIAQCNQADQTVQYVSANLKIEQLSENVFLHESYLETNDFGKVKCNGAIFRSEDEVVIVDTPTNNGAADELIYWVTGKLNCRIIAVVPTHFHDDCLGGIHSFNENGIKSYAYSKTIKLAEGDSIFLESDPFDSEVKLEFGNDVSVISFFGKGHTYDNVVAYYPEEKALFGGCLIKSIGAGKGYLGNADTTEWSNTVRNIQSVYKDIELVIPGHGKSGDSDLLDYTADLFDQESN